MAVGPSFLKEKAPLFSQASFLVSGGMLCHALGGQAGGFLADSLAKRHPNTGRIAVCQLSVAMGELAFS